MLQALFINFIASFLSSCTFATLFNAPKKSLPYGGLIGALGWCSYWIVFQHSHKVFFASVLCALILSLLSRMMSRRLQMPAIVFFVPGLIPVVPGITFFNAFQALIEQEYRQAGLIFLNVFYTSIGIVCGLAISTILQQIYDAIHRQLTTKKESR